MNPMSINSVVFYPRFSSPEVGDFGLFNFNDEFLGEHQRTFRLCAKGGDTIEMREGRFFRNGEDFDKNFDFKTQLLLIR